MNLISVQFLCFFIVISIVYYLIPKRCQWKWLLICSLFFYLSSSVKSFFFLVLCVVTTYFAGVYIGHSKSETGKKWMLFFALAFNVFLLCYFKLFSYYFGLYERVFKRNTSISFESIIAPLGISYYTLQALSYCIDVYRGKTQTEKNFFRYFLYLSYFPLITQGPISRYHELNGELFVEHEFSYVSMAHGFQRILWGGIKKLVIADRLSITITSIFAEPVCGSLSLFGGMLFSIQLYSDFSGCMDIVGGCSEVLGIDLPNNFRNPFAAVSIKDFWRRWHISLSSWLKDYIFIPLGGSRCSTFRKNLNLVITFLISGLWHGAGINYLVWGLLHSAFQITENLFKNAYCGKEKKIFSALKFLRIRLVRQAVTFTVVSFAWIPFRANGMAEATKMIRLIFTDFNLALFTENFFNYVDERAYFWVLLVFIPVMLFIESMREKVDIREKIDEKSFFVRWIVYAIGIVSLVLLGKYGIDQTGMFLYARY